jgi:hypothetical protein
MVACQKFLSLLYFKIPLSVIFDKKSGQILRGVSDRLTQSNYENKDALVLSLIDFLLKMLLNAVIWG